MRERSVRVFVISALVLAVPPFVATLLLGHTALHEAINGHHAAWADTLFKYGTNLADGWTATIITLLLLLKNWRSFLMLGASAALSAIVAQALKHFVFDDVNRPAEFLNVMPQIRLVAGEELMHFNSFPSGHSTCAFSMCFAFAVIVARVRPAAMFAVLAALLAFSRVYLSQHFTEDVLAGAFIGTVTGFVVYRWLYRSAFSTRLWLDRSPFRYGRK